MKTPIAAALFGAAALGALVPLTLLTPPPAHAIPVYDGANHAQNLLIAARTLEQINNQIRSLQNEAAALANMAKHLSRVDFAELDALRQTLQRIDALMGQAQAIGFRVDELDARFGDLFPDPARRLVTNGQRVAEARTRLDASMAAFRHAMAVQAQVVENVRDDAAALAAIVARSQGAEGSLQVSQATNQLLALAAKQQFQLQQLMAAQFRSDAVVRARQAQQGEEARAATRRFLGDGRAYTPR